VKQLLCCSHPRSFNSFLQLAYLLIPFSDFSIVRGLWNNSGQLVLCSHAYVCMNVCMNVCISLYVYVFMHACMPVSKSKESNQKYFKSKIFYSHKTVTLMNINNRPISKTVICKNKATQKGEYR